MQRVDAPEILDSDACLPSDAQGVLIVLGRINRWFGGVATTQKMVNRVADRSGLKRLTYLEVAAGSGELPEIVRRRLARRGIALDVTLFDLAQSHLPATNCAIGKAGQNRGVVGDALSLPFANRAFDVVSCNLFAHHLNPQQLRQFVAEALRVSRRAVLINDLLRHPLHLALAYIGFPIMCNRIAWLDGLTSVRRAYQPDEIRTILAPEIAPVTQQIEISRHFLYRMAVMVWKTPA